MANAEVKRLVKVARALDAPPDQESHSVVEVSGEALVAPIYWQGRQWAVTAYGVECRDGSYAIEADRLWEEDDGPGGWVMHMSEKTWVDLPDFAEALRVARRRAAGRGTDKVPPRQRRSRK